MRETATTIATAATTAPIAVPMPPTNPAMAIATIRIKIRTSNIHLLYFATSNTHGGAAFCEIVSIDTMPSGGCGSGTTEISPLFTRASNGVRITGDTPSLRRGRVTRRNVPESIRSGTRLARTFDNTVVGLASSFECRGAVKFITVSGCAFTNCAR